MQPFLIFIFQFILLFLLSRSLTRALSEFFLSVTKSRSVTVSLISLLFFPGVVIHELAHAITAGVLMVPVGKIDLLPKMLEDGGLRLGSVMIGKSDIFRSFAIGLAPVFFGLVIILGVPFLAVGSLSFLPIWAIIYCLFVVGNTMFSSKKDLEGMVGLVFILIFLTVAFYVANLTFPFNIFVSFLSGKEVAAFFEKINSFILWTIGVDVASLLFFSFLSKIFSNRH